MAERTCSIDGCEGALVARGWCRKHYNRWHKHGDPLHVTPWSPPPQNRPRVVGCVVEECPDRHFARGYCHRHYTANWRSENPARAAAAQAEYRERNRDAARERSAAWRAANRDRALAASRAYHAANREAIRETRRRYRDANRAKIRAMNNRRKALQRNVLINDLTPDQWVAIIAAWDARCAYCGCEPDPITMDHVIPLSRGGGNTASNVVPACGPCNSSKGDGPAPPFITR